ncbi:MAG: dihydroorotate dehydrogenase electron transfer subunit [Acidobacteriota bacterium]
MLGRGTRILSTIKPGGTLRCLVPLGNGFPAADDSTSRLLLVAGGIGSASLHPLALRDQGAGRRPVFLFGCRSAPDLAGIESTRGAGIEVQIATEDGSAGEKGYISDLLDSFLASRDPSAWRICACGPTPMMKATALIARRHGVRCQLCLETPMACGFGVCVGCVVATRKQPGGETTYRRICVDGPVFDASEVIL